MKNKKKVYEIKNKKKMLTNIINKYKIYLLKGVKIWIMENLHWTS